ncbi:Ubiquitination Target receptor [Acrodontium crateriforme]|uniref:Ubiquitination Target receptor n=1 Tax=Acrodontium crateriforme TaxID=150365 RepID=A0AAQ3M252_9PEZI|nr:Ubiquitination Target receptor [Acrodontium crateriforme]
MSNSLERVSTVNQTSLGATRLPLELQQQVFSYLDTSSFYAACRVCKWWRFASLDAVTLTKQLKKLPILPPVNAARTNPLQLQKLFYEAAHTLMVDLRLKRQEDKEGAVDKTLRSQPKATATADGSRTVTISDRTITLFDTSSDKPVALAQRTLNDLKETVGSGPWLKLAPTSGYHVALSSKGTLLAIAQERTIQIYDLTAESDSFTVNEYIPSASGHFIEGLDFEHDDFMLRVRLSSKGTVLYLGTPNNEVDREACLGFWKSKKGLQHTYLDSSSLAPSTAAGGDNTTRITGLQLLKPFGEGFLLAGQHHGGGESSYYILAHIIHSTPHNTQAVTAEPSSIKIVAKLESFLSAWRYSLQGQHERGLGLWENMPSAHEHAPRFALRPDGRALILAEREKKRIRPYGLTQLFVYRVPGPARIQKILKSERRSVKETFLEKMEKMPSMESHETPYSVGRIPYCLTTVAGDVTNLKFETIRQNEDRMADGCGVESSMLSAMTSESTKRWIFADL